jgi:hypothetical protein
MSINNNIPGENEGSSKSRKEPFSAPEGYFNSFADSLSASIEREELREAAPVLFGLKKTDFFAAPQGYFDHFHSALQERISMTRNKLFFGLFTRKQLTFSFRAIAVIFVAGFFILRSMQEPVVSTELSEVPAEEIDLYLAEEIETGISTDEMMDYINEEEIAFNTNIVDAENEDLEDYIMNESNLNEIIDEF